MLPKFSTVESVTQYFESGVIVTEITREYGSGSDALVQYTIEGRDGRYSFYAQAGRSGKIIYDYNLKSPEECKRKIRDYQRNIH